MFETGEGFDWATAEALAFGSLLQEGSACACRARIRGAAPSRSAMRCWVDQKTRPLYPAANLHSTRRFQVLDSPLSEFGVLGFEYGYASTAPNTLVLWEAQFGDFANGAQVMIDQFICSG
jgi:2-oxoglutarate dehydrogenase E1 component